MSFKIGFVADYPDDASFPVVNAAQQNGSKPRKSVVRVYFDTRNTTLSYYNDQFDLHCGDLVYVDGKLGGLRGRVTDVNYNFKIKVSEYKRVIAVADTTVHGQFFTAGSHFVTFDRQTIPREKVRMWFVAPLKDDDVFVSGNDDTAFCLDNLSEMKIGPAIAERGHNYYLENRVRYICVEGQRGYAIVEGSEAYEVEFEYHNGEISGLVCSCFCSYNCKHEFAAMLQLRETLEWIGKHYESKCKDDYFAAITKGDLFTFAIDGKEAVSLSL